MTWFYFSQPDRPENSKSQLNLTVAKPTEMKNKNAKTTQIEFEIGKFSHIIKKLIIFFWEP